MVENLPKARIILGLRRSLNTKPTLTLQDLLITVSLQGTSGSVGVLEVVLQTFRDLQLIVEISRILAWWCARNSAF
jgi:hypothetical protein